MIRIEVTMHGNLRRFLPGGVASMQIELPEGTSVAEVIERLRGQHEIWVAAIGEEVVALSTRLADGAQIEFFPHIDGG